MPRSERGPVEVLREWKAKREAEFDTATREALQGLGDLPTRLPDLLIEAFRDATAELSAAVDRLEAAGQLIHDTAQLLQAALAGTGNAGPGVGDGVPGVKEAFEEAHDAAGGASFLGLPSADAYEAGPGAVQHLRGARCGHPAVICAITGRPAVVITADLWNGMTQVGAGRPGGGIHGVGFPAHTTGDNQRSVGPAVDQIPTAGGSWHGGTMRRTGDVRCRRSRNYLSTGDTTHKTHLSRLDIGVVGRASLSKHDARDVVRQALVRAADAADLVTW